MPSSSNPTEQFDFAAEVFFGKQEADAGRRALEEAGFDIEPLPDNLAGDGGQTVWMMAYAGCPRDAAPFEIVQKLYALIGPHGGMVWELGPISSEGEPAPPRFYEMMQHAVFRRTNLYPLQFEPGRSDD